MLDTYQLTGGGSKSAAPCYVAVPQPLCIDDLHLLSCWQATDIVTCGGLQSAHTLAVAAASAQHGKRTHLLVRGERPAVPTGSHL